MGNVNLLTVFATGLITGGLTCMAVQGGLLAATLAQREEQKMEEKAKGGNALPIVSFLIAKLAAYTALGALLGLLGSFFTLSLQLRALLQIAVAVFMIGTALNILNVHPVFRYFIIQPPKFLTRLVRKQSKSQAVFAPALLGGFTIFIPCGTTQAMMALSVATGNPVLGASIMFAFILGTSPVFFILGYFATKLGDIFHENFMRLAAFAIILLAVFNANNAFALLGSSLTIENGVSKVSVIAKGFWCTVSWCGQDGFGNSNEVKENPVSEQTITISSQGYSPTYFSVKAGSKVTVRLTNTNGRGCQQGFTIPQFGIQRVVPVGATDTLTFTAPNSIGKIAFTCSMGMYRGIINVI